MLLFSLGVVVSVELSVVCDIHIGKDERSMCISDGRTEQALVFFQCFGEWLVEYGRIFSLKLSTTQGKSSLKISAH